MLCQVICGVSQRIQRSRRRSDRITPLSVPVLSPVLRDPCTVSTQKDQAGPRNSDGMEACVCTFVMKRIRTRSPRRGSRALLFFLKGILLHDRHPSLAALRNVAKYIGRTRQYAVSMLESWCSDYSPTWRCIPPYLVRFRTIEACI